MKKLISAALVLIMLMSGYSGVFAESVGGFTPEEVFQWLDESDENVSTAKMQAVNGAHRLAEILVCLASPNADEEMTQEMLDWLGYMTESREDENSTQPDLMAVGTIAVCHVLKILCEEIDTEGANSEGLNAILDYYNAQDEAAEDVNGQTVNALETAYRLAALMAIYISTSQEEAAQIQEALDEAAAFEPTDNPWDAMANSSEWLYRMLCAFVKIQDSSKIDQIEALTASTEELVENTEAPEQAVTNWLYSSVNAIGILLDTITFDTDI
ncbi:MAG: hypothetical protein IJ899_03430 [Blautia sp.]|nr:hypothetical protein [Blautia sp.]